jgi:hypothetical protein
MSAPLVIEHLDVIEQGFLGVRVASKRSPASLFTVENQLSMTALS